METVNDIMTLKPVACNPETTIEAVARMMASHDCGEIPVLDVDQRPIGIITDRDITCRTIALGKNPLSMKAVEIMSVPVVTVSPEMSIERVCAIMELKLIRRVVVVDDHGKCCGVVSLADIAKSGDESMIYNMFRELSQPSTTDLTH